MKPRGFTLWEAILSLMLIAIATVAVAPMLANSMQAYLVARAVQPSLDRGRLAMERLVRDLRHSLCATLVATSGSLRYTHRTEGETLLDQRDSRNISGPAIYLRQPASATARLLTDGVQADSLRFVVERQTGPGACLVTVSFIMTATLPGTDQIATFPLTSRVAVWIDP